MQAMAQEPDGAATTLDAILVTANKRVENLQEVPKQIMVVTPEALTRSGVTTLRELGNAIPSISGTASGDERSPAPPIRGIASFAYSIGVQSQTGVVVDDVPQPSFSSLFKELADVERVEVLAGPQSTLSGRNASGGLINIVTREPSDIFSAEAFFEHTSDRQQRLSAFMTGPLSDTLAFSVSAFSNEWGGHFRSLVETNGKRPLHLGGWDAQGVRGKLRWQPNERLSSTLILYTMENTTLLHLSSHMALFSMPIQPQSWCWIRTDGICRNCILVWKSSAIIDQLELHCIQPMKPVITVVASRWNMNWTMALP